MGRNGPIDTAVAAHEAGHAICAASVGRRVLEVTMQPEGGYLGLTSFAVGIKHSRVPALHDLHVAVGLVGGELGEELAVVPGIDCPTTEREIAQRRCEQIAPSLGVDSAFLYAFVLRIARHALTINRTQFDRLRWALQSQREIRGVAMTKALSGQRRVDLLRSWDAHRTAAGGACRALSLPKPKK